MKSDSLELEGIMEYPDVTARPGSAFREKRTLGLCTGWSFRDAKSTDWISANVPGCVHTDLLRHKKIPAPFWGSNESELQWIETRDWHYCCAFELDPSWLEFEHLDLVAEGLDTLATLYLNDQVIGRTENMFIGYRFDIRPAIREGANTLEIHFANPMDYIKARQNASDYPEWNDPVGGCTYIRKEQCSFGWDWGPRFATCGVYKPLGIEGWSGNRIESVRITQNHSIDGVSLHIKHRLACQDGAEIRGEVTLQGEKIGEISGPTFRVPEPQLWWPNGHGKQPLYTVKLELMRYGRVIDSWSERIGLRTIALDRHKDEIGECFQFIVNGRTIFAKGANWIPAHSFVTETTLATYDNLLESARSAHMNMIRVWGGGIYEMDDFYRLCDEKGLLVWQDFMFACGLYPGDADFIQSVRSEAEYQVTRLANHACLALWCGNNEIEQMVDEVLRTPQRRKAYEDIFHHLLPEIVSRQDGVTAYWPSSPHNPAGYEKGFNNENAGDCHYWDVWQNRHPVKSYETKGFRFCSEFGMQSYSSPEVAATFCHPEEFNVFGPAMENHQKNRAGNLIILEYISRRYRYPEDYAALSYLSQLNQAYCMKIGVEHFRRSMPRTMGALYWQLNDCWPVFSWSSIEFGGKWKALHYAARRFFAPFLVSAHVPGDEKLHIGNSVQSSIREVHLHTVSDAPIQTAGRLSWTLFHLDGRTLESGEMPVVLSYGEALRRKTLDLQHAIETHGARNIYLRIRLETETGEVSQDTVFLTAPRFMELPRTPISVRVEETSDRNFELHFSSAGFQHQVQFDLRNIPNQATDNYFDLYPREPHVVRIKTNQKITKQDVKRSLAIYSLADTY